MYKALVPYPISVTLLEVKSLTAAHLPAMLELDQLCFGGLWTLTAYQRELESPNSDLLGIFSPPVPCPLLSPCPLPPAPCPLLAIGCLWAILEEAHVTILAVHPQYRRQGLGQALLIALLKAALHRGLERATLEVRASNSSALSLYKKFDFKLAGRRRGYYQDTGEDALILWRGGLGHAELPQTLAHWHQEAAVRLAAFGWNFSATSP